MSLTMENNSILQTACDFLGRAEFDGHYGAFFEEKIKDKNLRIIVDPDWVEPKRITVTVQCLFPGKVRWDLLAVALHPKNSQARWAFRRFNSHGLAVFGNLEPDEYRVVGLTAFGFVEKGNKTGYSVCDRLRFDKTPTGFSAYSTDRELGGGRLVVLSGKSGESSPAWDCSFPLTETGAEITVEQPRRLAAASEESLIFFIVPKIPRTDFKTLPFGQSQSENVWAQEVKAGDMEEWSMQLHAEIQSLQLGASKGRIPLSRSLIQDFNKSYEGGEFDGLKSSLLPFLKSNREKLQNFIDGFCKKYPNQSLDKIIKMFILSYNMPFDMKSYMASQSQAMAKDIGPEIQSTRRQELVSEWMRNKAAKFREHSMLQQIFCFEKMKNEIVPLIECDLNLP